MDKIQKIVRQAERPEAYYKVLASRINTGRAVGVLNKMIDGQEVTAQQEKAALFVLNKFLPNLQAIAVQHSTDQPKTRDDIEALANQAGIPLQLIWNSLNNQQLTDQDQSIIEHETPEKSITCTDST